MKTVLIINAGSSSVKFRVYQGSRIVVDGVVDRIGPHAILEITRDKKIEAKAHALNHSQAGVIIMDHIDNLAVDLVVHRVVYGGHHREPTVITQNLIYELKRYIPLAPLHMPPSIALIEFFHHRLQVTAVACFDTMFHADMPLVAKSYALPEHIVKKYDIYRRGFHGLAHEAMARDIARRMKRPLASLNIITCQLGNGSSVCAIKKGKSIDTSMGFTPLEGLIMGTRCGSIDPAIIPFLCIHEHHSAAHILHMLEHESGLKGLTGQSDVRDILARAAKKDKQAILALDMIAYHVQKYIGAYIAALGRVDAIVLGGGIPRSVVMRMKILQGLEVFDIIVDKQRIEKKMPAKISRGKVQVWVIDADEQEHMLYLAKRF